MSNGFSCKHKYSQHLLSHGVKLKVKEKPILVFVFPFHGKLFHSTLKFAAFFSISFLSFCINMIHSSKRTCFLFLQAASLESRVQRVTSAKIPSAVSVKLLLLKLFSIEFDCFITPPTLEMINIVMNISRASRRREKE